jgi:hypothetical protein
MAFSSRLLSKSKQVLPTIPDRPCYFAPLRFVDRFSALISDSFRICLLGYPGSAVFDGSQTKYFLRSEMVNILGFCGLVSFKYPHFLGNQTEG